MKAIILAADIGSRLENSNPKPLTKLKNGETILERQVAYLSDYLGMNNIIAIVGYKKDLIMESFPNLLYVYNNFYDTTNTSKSLLAGLIKIENEDVVWLNGDVVFEKKLLPQIIKCPKSCMAVNTNSVGEEEIKYNVFDEGNIKDVSKIVSPALGEAVGINKIIASDLPLLKAKLEKCDHQDYFEKALELSIQYGMKIIPVDINKYLCMEIDFLDDLEQINKQL
ncbi:phosphocholine cytidylyltransferase family protein [Marine Group I thaumarchaeote]|uniref:Phosphocholine cytidylyltransferase family protein n=1 Tax=Marine Group I thaumarchaeote TaxID=2511932 RepID=A0A7K4MQG7_9ARCH|nr:phosphocholine cytidylyltransferase family protein [Marine Group I thaumarchaeote]